MLRSIFILIILFVGCKQQTSLKGVERTSKGVDSIVIQKTDSVSTKVFVPKSFQGLADTTFVRLADFSKDFVYDLRYATDNNFLKAKLYDCAECYVRAKTAKALIAVNKVFMDGGHRIKFFDCYRPNSVQHKMWKIMPNPQYVANPVKGSIHNKGGAVDVTLVDNEGNELDMGTEFDFFGRRAYHDYTDLPQEILDNRRLLKETLESNGFWGIRTEWWHYNLTGGSKFKVEDFVWPCP